MSGCGYCFFICKYTQVSVYNDARVPDVQKLCLPRLPNLTSGSPFSILECKIQYSLMEALFIMILRGVTLELSPSLLSYLCKLTGIYPVYDRIWAYIPSKQLTQTFYSWRVWGRKCVYKTTFLSNLISRSTTNSKLLFATNSLAVLEKSSYIFKYQIIHWEL